MTFIPLVFFLFKTLSRVCCWKKIFFSKTSTLYINPLLVSVCLSRNPRLKLSLPPPAASGRERSDDIEEREEERWTWKVSAPEKKEEKEEKEEEETDEESEEEEECDVTPSLLKT